MHVLKAPAAHIGTCKETVRVGRVSFLRDFYENILLCKDTQPSEAFYILNPNVQERVRALENFIVNQKI